MKIEKVLYKHINSWIPAFAGMTEEIAALRSQ
jgi:hypothetical protein